MLGFLYALIAGAAMSVQGVMNTRLGDKVGVLEANAMVQLMDQMAEQLEQQQGILGVKELYRQVLASHSEDQA